MGDKWSQVVTRHDATSAALAHMDGPFAYAVLDCCLAPAKAFRALWGVETMAGLSYASQEEAHALLRANGGLLRLAMRQFRQRGLRRVSERPGAIGVVRHGGAHKGGLCIGPGAWAIKADHGVLFERVKPVTVWGI